MILTEVHFFKKYAKQFMHCLRNTLMLYEYECTCIACGYNTIKRKKILQIYNEKKTSLSVVRKMLRRGYFEFV